MTQPFDSAPEGRAATHSEVSSENEAFASTVADNTLHEAFENPHHKMGVSVVCRKLGELFGQDKELKRNMMEGCRNYCRENGIEYNEALFPFILESIITDFTDSKILAYQDIITRHMYMALREENEGSGTNVDDESAASRAALRERLFTDDLYDYLFGK